MKRIVLSLPALFILVILASDYRAQGLSDTMSEMDKAQEAADIRASKTLVAFMSLETMFRDERVRLLAAAAGKGKLAKIERLVAEGVDVNSRGTQNATPLFWAMRNLKGFTKLLQLGADPNVVFGDGGTVMHWAAMNEDTAFLRVALQYGGDPNLVAGMFMYTPLFEAIGMNDEAVEILLDAGASMDARTASGQTPLTVAAGIGRFDVVYLLLSRGADYALTDNTEFNLVDIIADNQGAFVPGHELWMNRVIDWLRERGVEVPR